MKLFFLSFFALISGSVFAQPKLINQAVVTTITDVTAPEEEDVSRVQIQGSGGFSSMGSMGDGETKSTTYIKNDLVKTSYKSEMARGSMYRNNSTKITTTIVEMMGNKFGFYISDEEMRKKADSMAQKAKTDTSVKRRPVFPVSVAYTEETKKVAGYNCKKAWLITDKIIAKDSLAVWFTPEIKFANVSSTGGMNGIGNMGAANGFDKIDGFIMQYERNMPRGRKMEVKVTKIETDKEIDDKEFEIPKDIEIKSMNEMGGGANGGGVRMMIRQ